MILCELEQELDEDLLEQDYSRFASDTHGIFYSVSFLWFQKMDQRTLLLKLDKPVLFAE